MECCCPPDNNLISQISNYANVITAIAGFALAFYVFIYQRGKENLNIKLQWFKDLIINQNIQKIYQFYDQIVEFAQSLNQAPISDKEKSEILGNIKSICSRFRKDFINLLFIVDGAMARDIQKQMDLTLDDITKAVDNPRLALQNPFVFENNILTPIFRNRNFTLYRILKYDGRTTPVKPSKAKTAKSKK